MIWRRYRISASIGVLLLMLGLLALRAEAHDRRVKTITLKASGATTGSGQTTAFDVSEFTEAVCTLNITAVSGTSPTLDVKGEISSDNSTFFAHKNQGSASQTVFTQKTATGKDSLTFNQLGRYFRFDYAIGGTTPSFTWDAICMFKN